MYAVHRQFNHSFRQDLSLNLLVFRRNSTELELTNALLWLFAATITTIVVVSAALGDMISPVVVGNVSTNTASCSQAFNAYSR